MGKIKDPVYCDPNKIPHKVISVPVHVDFQDFGQFIAALGGISNFKFIAALGADGESHGQSQPQPRWQSQRTASAAGAAGCGAAGRGAGAACRYYKAGSRWTPTVEEASWLYVSCCLSFARSPTKIDTGSQPTTDRCPDC